MSNEHTLDQLRALRLDGMVHAIEEQATSTATAALGFDEHHRLSAQDDLPTATVGSSQAPTAAVDKSAPHRTSIRFAVSGSMPLWLLSYVRPLACAHFRASAMALKRRPRSD